MTALPPCRCAIPGPLVETGSVVARECEAEIPVGEAFMDGDGEGEGETDGDGEGECEGTLTGGSTGASGATVFDSGAGADVVPDCWLTP